jgi:hypothetical protein
MDANVDATIWLRLSLLRIGRRGKVRARPGLAGPVDSRRSRQL